MNLHDNKRNASLLLIAISIAAIGMGIFELTRHTVDCGAQVMKAGQVCQYAFQSGTHAGRTVAEQRHQNRVIAVISFVGAALAGGYAVRNLVKMRTSPPALPVPGAPVRPAPPGAGQSR